ncbi:glycoside hydrolase family 15 protein [bacterium]|nr:glycoside hydrolase family 15 protein [bacterium]MCI0680408.1 glycoside hydrolase family 15 protein [bacterium]
MAVLENHLNNIRELSTESGLFLASSKSVPTGYNKAWLRDNFYTAFAFEQTGDYETVRKVYRAILDIFLKHEYKIDWAVKQKPYEAWQYIHARYHPETFEEYWEEWGNKQSDAVGCILFKLAELEEKGKGVIESEYDKRIVQRLVDYLSSIEYWHDPDNGMWEEYEEVHSSSIGAALAGLKKIAMLSFVTVPEGLIPRGEEALGKLLPRESRSKFADLALLSLIYPYRIVSDEMARTLIGNVAYHLERRRGLIRYRNDRYYNKNEDGVSEEAEWTFGFSWLAIAEAALGDMEKARAYLAKAEGTVLPDGKIPELYYSNSDRPNENIPLGWAESMFVVAHKMCED